MSRFISGINTNPGHDYASRIEPLLSGSYGFEVYDVFPRLIEIPEWFSSLWLGDSSGNADTASIFKGTSWGNRVRWQGSKQSFGISGITRDMYGTPLAGCTIKLFRTSTGELVYSTLSDANGYYEVATPYTDAHFVVAFKDGTPDFQGVTNDNILGG